MFLSIWAACWPAQANVNSAVTSAQALQISSLIPPAGSWNRPRGRARDGGAGGGRLAAIHDSLYIFKKSENKTLFCMKCSLQSSNVEQVAIRDLMVIAYLCKNVWMICLHFVCCARGLSAQCERVHQWVEHLRDFRGSCEDKYNGCNSILIQLQLFHYIKLPKFTLIRYYHGRGHGAAGFHGYSQKPTVKWNIEWNITPTLTTRLHDFKIFPPSAEYLSGRETGGRPAVRVHGMDG